MFDTSIQPQFAPVAPLPLLKLLSRAGQLGNYHMLLAQEVIRDLPGWAEFYRERRKMGQVDTIIMDNGAWEGIRPLSVSSIVLASVCVEATYLVLPDVIMNTALSVQASMESFKEILRRPIKVTTKIMSILQGKNPQEMERSASMLSPISRAFGLPKLYVEQCGSRYELALEITRKYHRPVHLFGMSKKVEDDVATLKIPGVLGMDSTAPTRMGLQGILLPNDPWDVEAIRMKREEDYLRWNEEHYPDEVTQNLQRMDTWLRRS